MFIKILNVEKEKNLKEIGFIDIYVVIFVCFVKEY